MSEKDSQQLSASITSIIELFESSIKENWDLIAYSDYGTEQSYTFGAVAKLIAAQHSLFKDCGIEPGDKIALCDKNSSRWAISYIAILTYGAVVVPILADFNNEQVEHIYKHSDAKLMIGRDGLPATPLLNISNWTMGENGCSLQDYDMSKLTAVDVKYFREKPNDLALISYTSGSTGHSKGVMLPYRSLWSNVMFADGAMHLKRGDSTLAFLPTAHMYGMAFDFLYEFCVGCHVHFLTKAPSPAVIIKAFNDIRPQLIITVPLIIEKVVQGQVFPKLRTLKMRLLMKLPYMKRIIHKKIRKKLIAIFGGNFYEIIVGGAPFNKDVENLLAAMHFPYTVGYGMTECGPIISYEDWKLFVKGSCGKAAPRMEIKIDSAEPEHTPGEILTRGTNVMLGYYKNEAATTEAIDADGWLHTGDLATMDKHGNVFIRGRKKAMLLGANGQNIYPEEIEGMILSNSIFDECLVVQRKEKLVALVYVSDETLKLHNITPEALCANVNRHRNHMNNILPKFANLSALELQDSPFEKTPKRNIKRFLYK